MNTQIVAAEDNVVKLSKKREEALALIEWYEREGRPFLLTNESPLLSDPKADGATDDVRR
jgi:hypothetical protein